MTQAKLPRRKTAKLRPLFDGAEWTFDLIRKVDDASHTGTPPTPSGWFT